MQWFFVHCEQGFFWNKEEKRNRLVICVLHAVLLELGIFCALRAVLFERGILCFLCTLRGPFRTRNTLVICALRAVFLERGILEDLLVCALCAVVLW